MLVALLAIGFVLNPRFLSLDNLKVTTRDSAILGIAAIGVSFTILTGGIDLSIGSMVGLGGILVALFIQNWGLPIWLSMILTLGIVQSGGPVETALIFICENNRYGMGTPVHRAVALYENVAEAARSYGIRAERVDGMDVLEVRGLMRTVVDQVRGGQGPFLSRR